MSTKYFEFDQNNSGGSFVIDDDRGLGPSVWIEALDVGHAQSRAEEIGIYFDGCEAGLDCECCGDRWYRSCGDGSKRPEIDSKYAFGWHDTVYVHKLDGSIERIKESA